MVPLKPEEYVWWLFRFIVNDNLNNEWREQSQNLNLHQLVEPLQLDPHPHLHVLEQRVGLPLNTYFREDAPSLVQLPRLLRVGRSQGDLALEAVLGQHQGAGFGLDLGEDGLLGGFPLLEELVGVVVRRGSGGVSGHAVPHVHLVTDLCHFELVDWIEDRVLMKEGRGSRSIAATSSR